MRLGIIANMSRPDAEKVIGRIVEWGDSNAVELTLCKTASDSIETSLPVVPRDEIAARSDVVVSLGGDGTMLATARAVGDAGIPILGINLGSLGFLTQLQPAVLEETLSAVLDGKYILEERMVAEVELENNEQLDSNFALNDIVIDRGSVSRLISLNLYANGSFICSYTADGLIVSTPTGSTAYSLAVGGPILSPAMNAFIVSPISAFALTTRPIVFPDHDELRIVTRSKHSDPVLTLDGQVSCRLSQESSIIIRRAGYHINFIVLKKNSFYDVLRGKLHWGKLPEGNSGSN